MRRISERKQTIMLKDRLPEAELQLTYILEKLCRAVESCNTLDVFSGIEF